MPTQWSQTEMDFGSSGGRKLVGAFDGGAITSNGGVVLLAAAEKLLGLGARLAACFTDHRNPARIEHGLADLLRQRIFAQALGHEDLIDHDALRLDPALMAALDKPEETLAGKSTLNRLEHAGKIGLDRHHKLDHDPRAMSTALLQPLGVEHEPLTVPMKGFDHVTSASPKDEDCATERLCGALHNRSYVSADVM